MKDFKNYYILPAPPDEVFAALTIPETIRLWTGEDAIMSTIVESEFSLWDGSITGKNLEFEEGQRIVQQWYFDGQEEPSIVTIKLHPHKQGTSVEVKHVNIPDEAFEDISDGWNDSYFGSLMEFYED